MLTGNCLSCNSGSILSGVTCISTTSNGSYIQNNTINCQQYDPIKQTCVTCYTGYYYNIGTNSCLITKANCQTTDPINGQCVTCVNGYQVAGGNCISASTINSQVGSNVYCTQFNGSACIQCMNRYFVKNQTCYPIDSNCLTYNSTTGYCIACYSGYQVSSQGNCSLNSGNTLSDPFCNGVNNSQCVSCIPGYYVDPLSGQCSLVSILCANYVMLTGVCISCTSGNVLQNGVCFTPALGVDPNCALYNGVYCSSCVNGYQLVSFVCQHSQ